MTDTLPDWYDHWRLAGPDDDAGDTDDTDHDPDPDDVERDSLDRGLDYLDERGL